MINAPVPELHKSLLHTIVTVPAHYLAGTCDFMNVQPHSMDAIGVARQKKPTATLRAFFVGRASKEMEVVTHRNILMFAAFCFAFCHSPATAQVGSKPAGIKLVDANGKTFTLDSFAGKILVLEFWSFKCPVTLAYDQRMAALQAKFSSRGVEFLAIASNKNESAVETARNAENLRLPIRVFLDPDGVAAEICGATHTPSVVLLDGSGVMRYRGAIDNNKQATESGRVAYVEEAIAKLLANRPVDPSETKVFGCSIKK